MASKTTTVDGHHVELELDVDYGDGPRSQCWINRKVGRVEYTASLAALQDCGQLIHAEHGDLAVAPATIERITTWADDNGYNN